MNVLVEELADDLALRGIAVHREFAPRDEVVALARECRDAWAAGTLEPAHVGHGAGRERRRDIRGDYIRWLQDTEPSDAVCGVLARLEELRRVINRRSYLGLLELECHFALYPPGTAYARHLDAFRDRSLRAVSWVLYLNEDWNETDGGALRIYRPSTAGETTGHPGVPPIGGNYFDVPPAGGDHFDVPPIGGTLVCFLSAEYEHEVLPARRERMSLTGWFTTRR